MSGYIPKRKIKKNRYLELKKVNEEYESILDIWGSHEGDDEKTRKIKARELLKTHPELSIFRAVLTSTPSENETELAEGCRYWMMKENGTLPTKTKAVKKQPLSILNPVVEEATTVEVPPVSVEPAAPKDLSLTKDIVIQAAEEEKVVGKKQKVTFGKKVAKFFGF